MFDDTSLLTVQASISTSVEVQTTQRRILKVRSIAPPSSGKFRFVSIARVKPRLLSLHDFDTLCNRIGKHHFRMDGRAMSTVPRLRPVHE